ncbi:MAG: MBL fold metallo-hydrolase, partial [Candidatus Omnitrophota bacterium]|nr:MBL fold metallo-hydrolase [Candidatus Omnitrophota bacterium]
MNPSRPDPALASATEIVEAARANPALRPLVRSFFDEETFTVSHVVRDPGSKACAIID